MASKAAVAAGKVAAGCPVSTNGLFPMSANTIVLYCGLLLSVTAFSVDITLPAFSLIAADLSADYALVQLIIPAFIMATGLGQMLAGPLSDRFGRKPVILAGLSIYSAGALLCLVAPAIEWLLAGRCIQGLGAAVGPVIGRAVIRDLFHGTELARNMALATMIFAFGPIVAPLLGVGIMQMGTWRLIFMVIAAFGIALLVIGAWRLPETIPARDREATRPRRIAANLSTVFAHPASRFYVLLAGPVMAMMLSILISIPRVYEESFGISGTLFAVLFALHGLGIIAGQFVNRMMIRRLGIVPAMLTGAVVVMLTSCLMVLLALAGLKGPYVLSAMMILFATSFLIVMSNSTALALDPHPMIAGFVSSLFGFLAQLVGSLIAIGAAMWIGGDTMRFAIAITCLSGFVLAAIVVKERRQLERTARPQA